MLCALVCAGHMYGMEPLATKNPYELLPKELKQIIITNALITSKSVDDIINAVKAFATLHKVRYNTPAVINLLMKRLPNNLIQAIDKVKNLHGTGPKDFTKLVHLLVGKFNISPYEVASSFNTPIAQEYLKLAKELKGFVSYFKDNEKTKELISQGADVNFYDHPAQRDNTYLNLAIAYTESESDIIRVKLLINAGANPFLKDYEFKNSLDKVLNSIQFWKKGIGRHNPTRANVILKNLETIQSLIEEAMQNYQQ